MFFEICLAIYCRLFERERKIAMIRKDRQMIVTEKRLRTLYCQRLFRVSLKKYLNF